MDDIKQEIRPGLLYRIEMRHSTETFEGMLQSIKRNSDGTIGEVSLESGVRYFRMEKHYFDQIDLGGQELEPERLEDDEKFYRTRSTARGDVRFDVC